MATVPPVARIVLWLCVSLALAGCAGSDPPPQIAIVRASGHQAETSIAIHPSNPQILLAGAGSTFGIEAYGSEDGGRSWTTALPPTPDWAGDDVCANGDPTTAIGRDGAQYLGYLLDANCSEDQIDERRLSVVVATRNGPDDRWTDPVPLARDHFDDKPVLAIDTIRGSAHEGRLYVAWSRLAAGSGTLLVAHSDDGGRTWSTPADVGLSVGSIQNSYASLAVGPGGALYVEFSAFGVEVHVRRSVDGGDTFEADRLVDRNFETPAPCDVNYVPIPAQRFRCVSANPTVAVRRGAVFVTYGGKGAGARGQDVFLAAFSENLRHRLLRARRPVPTDDGPTDQFQPASAVDASNGLLWVCYYETGRGSERRKTRYTCTSSADAGRSWRRPIRVASEWSDATAEGRDRFEYGDYQGLGAAGGVAHPIWTDFRHDTTAADPYTSILDAG